MGIIKALKLGFDYQRYDDDGNVVDMQRAVNDVDLDIKAGEFVAGPNPCWSRSLQTSRRQTRSGT